MLDMDTETNIGKTKVICENGVMYYQLDNFKVVSGGSVKGAAVCPITPNPCRENGDLVMVVVGSPLASESPKSSNVEGLGCSSSDEIVGSGLVDSLRTPGVFNPFVPGPEEMCFAPICKKRVNESRRFVARRLDFDYVDDGFVAMEDDDEDVDTIIEKELIDIVYGMLLEAIIFKQTEDFLAENSPLNSDGCCTPTSPTPINGIAETCPGAPMKASFRNSLNIDPGLRKKLEF